MLACVDVHYGEGRAAAACLVFRRWEDALPAEEHVARVDAIAPYEPGAFYKRELPCLLAVLAKTAPPEAVVIDGYVWLAEGRPGLGAHLYDALGGKVAVVGVAKTAFAGSAHAAKVCRGQARRPVFVTAAGMDQADAARHVAAMHGPYRVPTLLKRVDRLARDAVAGP
jgi:deoxyribonuclease V